MSLVLREVLVEVAQKRVERSAPAKWAGGAGVEAVEGGAGQAEVEQDEVEGVVAALGGDAEVLGLYVAVGDAAVLEVADGLEQVLAKALGDLGVEGLADAAGEGAGAADGGVGARIGVAVGVVAVAGVGQEQGAVPVDVEGVGVEQLDDGGVVEGGEGGGLGVEAVVVAGSLATLSTHTRPALAVPLASRAKAVDPWPRRPVTAKRPSRRVAPRRAMVTCGSSSAGSGLVQSSSTASRDSRVAEAPAAAALADAGLLDGLGDPGAGGPVDAPQRAAVAVRDQAREGGDNAADVLSLRGRSVAGLGVAAEDLVAAGRGERHGEARVGEEHDLGDVGHFRPVLGERLRPLQRLLQRLGLAAGQQAGVVERPPAAFGGGPLPCGPVGADPAGVGLDLDQVDAVVGDGEGVDLVQLAVRRRELEVRLELDAVGLAVGEAPAEKGQRLPLMVVRAVGDGGPAGRCRVHYWLVPRWLHRIPDERIRGRPVCRGSA